MTKDIDRLVNNAVATLTINGHDALDIAERATKAVAGFFGCEEDLVIIEDFSAEPTTIDSNGRVAIWSATIVGQMHDPEDS